MYELNPIIQSKISSENFNSDYLEGVRDVMRCFVNSPAVQQLVPRGFSTEPEDVMEFLGILVFSLEKPTLENFALQKIFKDFDARYSSLVQKKGRGRRGIIKKDAQGAAKE